MAGNLQPPPEQPKNLLLAPDLRVVERCQPQPILYLQPALPLEQMAHDVDRHAHVQCPEHQRPLAPVARLLTDALRQHVLQHRQIVRIDRVVSDVHADAVLRVHVSAALDQMSHQRQIAPVHRQMERCDQRFGHTEIDVGTGIEQCVDQLQTAATHRQIQERFTVHRHVDELGTGVEQPFDERRLTLFDRPV
uniref:Uncharacterized protein n=1 Tax=Anopheles dirus TaxID=7168 RepID=A0A182NSJ5_9DIPT